MTKLSPDGSALVYSTYLGGSDDDAGTAIAVNASGEAYITGSTKSGNFPTTAGAYQTSAKGSLDIFVTKLNAAGSVLAYSTYIAGGGQQAGQAIAINSGGEAFITGWAGSNNFPTTNGAFQESKSGSSNSAIVTKLNAAGSDLVYSTYLGGSSQEKGFGIAVDASGNAFITGFTTSSNFPTTAGAFQATLSGVQDSFVTKLNATGSAPLLYFTYLGGSGYEQGFDVAVDSAGDAYVTGYTTSANFPFTSGAFQTSYGGGAQDAFVTKLNSTGTGLAYSTYLGGSGFDEGSGITVDSCGSAYVVGYTSGNFPTTAGAYQTVFGGSTDLFITKLNEAGSGLAYSTYLGGSNAEVIAGRGIALDASSEIYVTGYTNSTDFPSTAGSFSPTPNSNIATASEAFITKLGLPGPPGEDYSV